MAEVHRLVRQVFEGVTETPVPTLKLVAVDARDSGTAAVQQELVLLAGDREVREVGYGTFAVHTLLSTSELRDRIQALLGDDNTAMVVEFETWSGCGRGIDSAWLMRRGH